MQLGLFLLEIQKTNTYFFVLYTGLSFTSSMPSIVAYNDGRGLKSHSGQLFIATSKNPLVMNTIYIIYISIYI